MFVFSVWCVSDLGQELGADGPVDGATLFCVFKDLVRHGGRDIGVFGTGVEMWPRSLLLGVVEAETNEPNVGKALKADNV